MSSETEIRPFRVDMPDEAIANARRQTTPGPGGLIDKGTKGKRARPVPIIAEIRPLVVRRAGLHQR